MAKTKTNSLTAAIVQYLNLNGYEVWRNNTVGIWSQARQRYIKNPHTKKGVSDIIGYSRKDSKFIAVEVKTGKDRLSPHQVEFMAGLSNAKGVCIVARTFDQFIDDFYKVTGKIKPNMLTTGLRLRDASANSYEGK